MIKFKLYLLLSVCLYFFSMPLFAQLTIEDKGEITTPIDQGNWLVGGNVQLSSATNNFSTSNQQFQIAPTVGYFLANKFLIGTRLYWGQSTFGGGLGGDSKFSVFQVTPLLRYYLGNNRVKPYLQLMGTIQTVKNSNSGFPNSFSSTNSSLLGQLGMELFLSPNVALNFNLTALIAGDGINENPISDLIGLNFSDRIILSTGINFYLSGKKGASASETPLVARYQKANSKILGVIGAINFAPFFTVGSFYSKKFMTAKTRRNILVEGFFGDGLFGRDFGALMLFRPELERFISINERLFFAPSGGVSMTLITGGGDTEFFLNAQVYPKFYLFTNRLILDAGFQVNSPFTQFSGDSDGEWVGSIVVGADYFIQHNLSLRGELYLRTFGDEQFGYSPIFDVLPERIFRIGINYFIEQ